ncbi:MAG TPA: hypothetical protein PK509_07320, partial [Catalimonadaceae bacterium]|nr:hypothetical protein [Catalimonadaceae bacterium]
TKGHFYSLWLQFLGTKQIIFLIWFLILKPNCLFYTIGCNKYLEGLLKTKHVCDVFLFIPESCRKE